MLYGMVGERKGQKAPLHKKGSRKKEDLDEVIDRFNHGIDDVDEMVMDEDSITDDTEKIELKDSIIEGHFTKPSQIEKDISWKKEETVPINELIIRNPKDRGLKKKKKK
jgi:hypothetical protein